ncbi:MAG: hypothetical protein CBC47_07035 [Alphaproteobacteria bacterium TMED87]|nr:hypothetical protein [Rhodospirillaceae bacterium]OUV08669.1 MAG: hypothetical protein CBC47_07035 [Alphaproteobacteria bacterium TMED87]
MIKKFINSFLFVLGIVVVILITSLLIPPNIILSRFLKTDNLSYTEITGSIFKGSIIGLKFKDIPISDLNFNLYSINPLSKSVKYSFKSHSNDLNLFIFTEFYSTNKIDVIINEFYLHTDLLSNIEYVSGHFILDNTNFTIQNNKCITANGYISLEGNLFFLTETQRLTLPLVCSENGYLGTNSFGLLGDIQYSLSLFLYSLNDIQIDVSLRNVNEFDQMLLMGFGFKTIRNSLVYSERFSLKY